MKLIVELRSGEGGTHSKKLVEEHFSIYCKYARRRGL